MTYVIRFWAALIGLIYALIASIITASVGLVFSIILLVCALVCSLAFFFFPNASDIVEQTTHIATSPLRFADSTIRAVWSQLLDMITGRARTSEAKDTAQITASTAMLLAFSAACFLGVAIAPISNYLTVVGYIIASLIVVVVWAVAAIRLSQRSPDVIRISAVVITLSTGVATITIIAISSFAFKSLTLALVSFGLVCLSAISLAAVWDQTGQSKKSDRPEPESAFGPSSRSGYYSGLPSGSGQYSGPRSASGYGKLP